MNVALGLNMEGGTFVLPVLEGSGYASGISGVIVGVGHSR